MPRPKDSPAKATACQDWPRQDVHLSLMTAFSVFMISLSWYNVVSLGYEIKTVWPEVTLLEHCSTNKAYYRGWVPNPRFP